MSKWVSVWIALLFRLSVLLRLPSLLVSPAIAVRKSWWTDETYGGNLLGCYTSVFQSRFVLNFGENKQRLCGTFTFSFGLASTLMWRLSEAALSIPSQVQLPPPKKKQLMFPSTAIMSKNLTTAESLSSQVSPDESINAAPNICYNIRCQVDISFSTVRVRPRWKKMSAYALRNACL